MKERSDLMSLFLRHGIGSLSDMRHIYDGGEDTYSGGTLKESKVSASLSRDQWNSLYRQGKVSLSEIPREYQSYIQGDPRNSGMLDTINQGREKFLRDAWNLGEVVVDSLPIIGDIKGLTLDPYLAYKNGGVEAALTSLMIGSVGVLPGGDALKFMKGISPEEAASYLRRLKEAGINADISVEDAQKVLNDRVDRINKDIADKVAKGERVSISGNRGIDNELDIDTYNKEGNVGVTQVVEKDGYNGIKFIQNTSEYTLGHKVPGQTIYGLDAARQVSNSRGRALISGEHLLEPEKTLKGHQHLIVRDLPKQGLLESRHLQDLIARWHEKPVRRDIIHDLNDPETVMNLNPILTGSDWRAHSYPTIFSDIPIERNGKTTYLIDPKDSWVLDYMDDRPGFYRREILGIKEPGKYPHTVYSRFPDVRSFDEAVLSPEDQPYFMNFGVFKFNRGGKLKKKSKRFA